MHQIRTQLSSFSAAHRVIKGYEGNCRNLHGHDYRPFLTFSSTKFDQFDFVIDFGDVKTVCNQWIKENWDHSVIVSSDDSPLLQFVRDNKQDHYVIPDGRNTTVEVLAQHLFYILLPKVEKELKPKNESLVLTEVEIWETQTSCARFKLD